MTTGSTVWLAPSCPGCAQAGKLRPSTTSAVATSALASRSLIMRAILCAAPLLVQPHVLHAAVVVERVVGDQALYVGPLREVFLSPGQHGAGHLRLEAALDLPHELEALAPVQLLRLQIDQLVRLFVAVVGVVAGGAALVVLEEIRIGVVEAARGEIGSELIVAPREGRKP